MDKETYEQIRNLTNLVNGYKLAMDDFMAKIEEKERLQSAKLADFNKRMEVSESLVRDAKYTSDDFAHVSRLNENVLEANAVLLKVQAIVDEQKADFEELNNQILDSNAQATKLNTQQVKIMHDLERILTHSRTTTFFLGSYLMSTGIDHSEYRRLLMEAYKKTQLYQKTNGSLGEAMKFLAVEA